MGYVATQDGTNIFYKDWGAGSPVVFSHGWPLNADVWDPQLLFMASNGFQAVAHDNPNGTPMEVFDDLRTKVLADRSQLYADLSVPFFGANRPGSNVSPGTRDQFWSMGMQVGLKAAYDCIRQFSQSDFTEDLTKLDVPMLAIHGDDDQIVPIAASAQLTTQIVQGAELKVYPGASHGLFATHTEQFNADLLDFIKR